MFHTTHGSTTTAARTAFILLAVLALLLSAFAVTSPALGAKPDEEEPNDAKKVFVCKYVGTPGVDERLQTGNNPISVSVNAIFPQFDGDPEELIGEEFADQHGASIVIAVDIGQPEPAPSACPATRDPDVSVAKSTSADPVTANGNFNYVFVVTISGTGSSLNVTLTDPLPDDFTYGTPVITSPDADDTCAITSGALSCWFGTEPSGTSITVTLQATTDAADCGAAITNTATVAATVDTNATNNTASADVTVTCAPDVTVAKSTSADPVSAGNNFNYVFIVTTSGTGPSANVQLSDPLPPNFTYGPPVITGGDAGDTCSTAGGALSCQFGTVASGTTITVTLSATTDADDCGPAITNMATVSSTVNTSTDNKTASADVTVVCAPDVSVVKSTSADPVPAGSNFNYVFQVTTGGTGPSANVTLTDPLPDNFIYGPPVITSPDADDICAIVSGALNCSFGTEPSGTIITVTLAATTDADDCGPAITNIATVASTVNTITNNDTASADVSVGCGSITIVKDASPNAEQDFMFTGEGLPVFLLDDDADVTLPSTLTFDDLAPGTYSVTEVTSDWTVSVTCSPGGTPNASNNRTANITLIAGANVTCTFLNTQ